MDSKQYWKLFIQTGAPELYILFNQARRMEATDVFEDQGVGATRNGLQ